jgi:hypothetical protein
MRTHTASFEIQHLEDFLKKYGGDIQTKDYELYAALLLARFHQKQLGGKHLIGFPIKRESVRKITPDESLEFVQKALRTCREEDSPIDVFIIPERNIQFRTHKFIKGNAFQLKRFISKGLNSDAAELIANYLNEIVPKKYSPIEASLVLLFEHISSLDLRKVQKLFRPFKFPFHSVMFIIADSEKIIFGEFWPNFGRQEYLWYELFEERMPKTKA